MGAEYLPVRPPDRLQVFHVESLIRHEYRETTHRRGSTTRGTDHLHQVAQSLAELSHEATGHKRLLAIPSNLAGNKEERTRGVKHSVGVAARISERRRVNQLSHAKTLSRNGSRGQRCTDCCELAVIAKNLCYAPRMAKKDKVKAKSTPASTMGGDPNLPSKDGPYVSENGGLYFVGVIVLLIVAASVGQLLLGN